MKTVLKSKPTLKTKRPEVLAKTMITTASLPAGNSDPEVGAGLKPAPTADAIGKTTRSGCAITGEGHHDLHAHRGVLKAGALDLYPELLHAITTRTAPDGGDWNLSAKRGSREHPANPEVALRNRQKLAELLGISLDRIVGCQQMHTSVVVRVGNEDAGSGMRPGLPSIEGADAMVTDVRGLYLMALSADCPPVFFYDPARWVVGLAHSGWKGTVGRIAGNVVEMMVGEFGCDPHEIVSVVGPGIGPCCYAVGENVIEAAEEAFARAWDGPKPLLEKRDGTTYFNLWEGVRRAIVEAGIPGANVTVEEVCTGHNLHLFYSHRVERGDCGLFGVVMGIRDNGQMTA